MKPLKAQQYFAELIGTFALTFAVTLSLTTNLPLATPLIAGLTLGLFVYTIGDISGAHINPAVTLSMLGLGKIDVRDTIFYIIFQVLGAYLAMLFAEYLIPGGLSGAGLVFDDTAPIALAEALGVFVLVFGISAVVFKKVNAGAAGLVVGGSLLLGILLTGGASHGVLNPAVAFGLGSRSLIYVLGPVIGGFLGAQVYAYLKSK